MGHVLLNYNLTAAGVNAVNTDMVAAVDADFSQRSSHYIFTERYRLYMAALVGASVIRGRFQAPTWNAIAEMAIFNANRSLQPPANPQVDMYDQFLPEIPQMEEFQIQASNNLGSSTEIENCPIVLLTDDWNANIPPGRLKFITRATFTVTPTLNAWSGPQAITLAQNLRGGVYAVIGAALQGSNSVAFRIIFPRYRLYHGRKLRPGWLVQNAVGDALNNQAEPWQVRLGEWGRFHTFELPQVEVFGTAANSTAYQLFLWLSFLGEDVNLLNSGLGGGM